MTCGKLFSSDCFIIGMNVVLISRELAATVTKVKKMLMVKHGVKVKCVSVKLNSN